MPKVVVVQRILPHYRVAFFDRLAAKLDERGVELKLVYGQEAPNTVPRSELIDASWARRIDNRYWRAGGAELVWQPCLAELRDADLVIIEQANRLLLNYLLMLGIGRRRAKVAFWGHGRNLQAANVAGLANRVKRALVKRADWWFAYTALSARIVAESGFPAARITTVDNSIDDSSLSSALAALHLRTRLEVARSLGFDGANLTVFCGGLHEHKRLPFLFAAALRLRERLPDFELVVIGGGPLAAEVRAFAERNPWMRWAGELRGPALAPYLYASRALLMPGPVGLVIIDSFIAQTPLITTNIASHGPEIEYLENGVNGLLTEDSVEAYVEGVAVALAAEDLRRRLVDGCRRSAARYTLAAMVERFAGGVLDCIGLTPAGERAGAST